MGQVETMTIHKGKHGTRLNSVQGLKKVVL